MATILGQSTTGTFAGTVSDATGGRIAQADVTALNVDTGQKYKSVTSGTGDFIIVQVPPGNYEVDVAAKGFKTLARKGLILEVAGKVTLDLALEVGAITESVSVTGEVPLLRTQDAQMGEVINALVVDNVPQLDRDPLNLLRLTGDISGTANANNPAGSPGSDVRINGGRMQGMDVLVDGNSVDSGKFHAVYAAGTPTMEQVDEFKVITNGIPAEYGRVSGGLVTMATRGGTNALHGQGFEYFKNQLLNANTWEANNETPYVAGQKAPRLGFHDNDYGGAIGGPVILPKIYNGKNKTFFYFNFDGTKLRTAGTPVETMSPSANDRVGNLTGLVSSGVGPQMYDPFGDTTTNSSGILLKTTLFPDNGQVIPAARINPLATLIDNYAPLPNNPSEPGWSQTDAWLGTKSAATNENRWDVRMDHNLTDNQRLTFRWYNDHYTLGNSEYYDIISPGNQQVRSRGFTGSLGWTWTINPTTIWEAHASVMHNPNRSLYNFPTGSAENIPLDPLYAQLTQGTPLGTDWRVWSSDAQGWSDPIGNQQAQDVQSLDTQTTYDFVSSVTKIWGRHTFKAGVDFRKMFDNHWEMLYDDLMYQGWATDPTDDNRDGCTIFCAPSWAANSWGDWLLGIPNGGAQNSLLNLTNEQNYYASYIQDDFKVNKKLTLNLGLRWDMESPISDRYNNTYAWNPNAPSAWTIPAGYNWNSALQAAGLTAAQIAMIPTPSWVTNGNVLPNGAACYVETPACPGHTAIKYHPWQFAPRLGGAYALNNKTVIRASWGMMYLTATGDYWNDWTEDVGAAAMPGVPDRLNGAINGPMIATDQLAFQPGEYTPFTKTNTGLNYTLGSQYEEAGTNINSHPPLEQNWNITVQRQLPGNILLEAGYNGNHSGDLLAAFYNSPYPLAALTGSTALDTLFKTQVANPLANQIHNSAPNVTTGATVPIGDLELPNPAFGGLVTYGNNIARANYNAGTLKLQKRLSQGITFLFTYTYSRSLDDIGTVAGGGLGGVTAGSKQYQSWQTINDLYGLSPEDMTHRITFYHDYQFPFGRGRKFLGSPKGVGGKVLDGIVGGWEYAGIYIFHTGTPITFGEDLSDPAASGDGVPGGNNGAGGLWANITVPLSQIQASNYNGNPNSLLTATNHTNVGSWGNLGSATTRLFNESDFIAPQPLTPGNVPNIFGGIREPHSTSYDASLMKNFSIAREGKIYLQLRVEAQNVFNIRGLGNYDCTIGDPSFGLITSSGQDPRQMQISGRLFF